MTLEGDAVRRTRQPSSEWRFHRDIYAARSDVGAIVHTHAPFATTLACLGRGDSRVPLHGRGRRRQGHPLRRYATFGTQALSDHALAALEARKACLLAQSRHDRRRRLARSRARARRRGRDSWPRCIGARCRSANRSLADAEMARVARQFEGYGRAELPLG